MSGLSVSDVVEWLKYIYIYDVFFVFFVSSLLPLNWHIAAIKTHTHSLVKFLQIDFSTLWCSCCCYGCWYLLIIPRSTLNSINYNIFMMILFLCFFFIFYFVEFVFESKIQLAGFGGWLLFIYLLALVFKKKKIKYVYNDVIIVNL